MIDNDGLNGRDRLEGPVDIDALFLHAVPAGNIEHDDTRDNEAGQGTQGSGADTTTDCGEQEGSDEHPEQVAEGDGADDGDHRNLADLPFDECAGVLKEFRFGEREQGDSQNRDQLRANCIEHEVQLCAHNAAGSRVDDTDLSNNRDDEDGDDRAAQGRVDVAYFLRDEPVEGPGEDDTAAIEEVCLREVDEGIEPGNCHDPQHDEVWFEDGSVESDPGHGFGIGYTGIAQVAFCGNPLQWNESLQQHGSHDEDRPGDDEGSPGTSEQGLFGLLDFTGEESRDVIAVEDPEAHDQTSQGHHGDIWIGDHTICFCQVDACGITSSTHELIPGSREGIGFGCAKLEVDNDPGKDTQEETDFQDPENGSGRQDHEQEGDEGTYRTDEDDSAFGNRIVCECI